MSDHSMRRSVRSIKSDIKSPSPNSEVA